MNKKILFCYQAMTDAEIVNQGGKKICKEGCCDQFKARISQGEQQVVETVGSPKTRAEVIAGCSVEKVDP